MQIIVKGDAHRMVAPDQIVASVTFHEHADSYDEVLQKGVQLVKDYFNFIEENTDFAATDFKTNAYNIREEFTTNRIEAKTEEDLSKNLTKRVSDGFFFTQYAYLKFDYNKERLSKLLVLTSKTEGAPRFHISFQLKDPKSYERGLIGDAYHDAQLKAETLAAAADKHLRDCIRVNIDNINARDDLDFGAVRMEKASFRGAAGPSIEEQMQTIDDTFHPDDIPIFKSIEVVWETSD